MTTPEPQGAFTRERVTSTPQTTPQGATILKVAASSRPSTVAGAIAGVLRGGVNASVQAVGAGAVNQAVKAIAIANAYLRDDGITICCTPSFADVAIDNQERTAICLLIEPRPRGE